MSEHDGTIDLLVADVVLAADSGSRAATRLRAIQPNLGVLYLSGHAHAMAQRYGVPADAPFLDKPCTTEQLAAAILGALER